MTLKPVINALHTIYKRAVETDIRKEAENDQTKDQTKRNRYQRTLISLLMEHILTDTEKMTAMDKELALLRAENTKLKDRINVMEDQTREVQEQMRVMGEAATASIQSFYALKSVMQQFDEVLQSKRSWM